MLQKSSRRRGRPRGFDDVALAGAAMDVFWRSGFNGASVGDLRAATGLSPSSIYNAHGSKEGLLCAALDVYLDFLEEHMFGPLAGGEAGLEDLGRLVDRLERTGIDGDGRGCLAVNTIAELREPAKAVRERIDRYRAIAGSAIDAGLERSVTRGEIDADDAAGLADELRAFAISFNLLAATGADPVACRAHANTMRAALAAAAKGRK